MTKLQTYHIEFSLLNCKPFLCYISDTFSTFSPETNNITSQASISTLMFSASTSLAVTPSSISIFSTIVKPTETITIGKVKLIKF